MKPDRLLVSNLGQIEQADIEFGDLTVLVGPQATGKSLLLECLELCVDGLAVRRTLRDNGIEPRDWSDFVQLVFGEGMQHLWTDSTTVSLNGSSIGKPLLRRRKGFEEAVHRLTFIPAQRTLALPTGFPQRFREFGPETPFVVRRYSAQLHDALVNGRYEKAGKLFPNPGRLRESMRQQIIGSVFHGAELLIDRNARANDLRLRLPDGSQLPMMAWTAGQREFIPLLLGLYSLLPAGKVSKDADIDWIVIEEPEMGLHPQAIIAVMNLVVNLVARGYKVVLSTHHPLVLDVVWTIAQIRESGHRDSAKILCKALGGGGDPRLVENAEAVLGKQLRVHALDYTKQGTVRTNDISSLDPGDVDEVVSGWGGLTGVSARLLDSVAAVSA